MGYFMKLLIGLIIIMLLVIPVMGADTKLATIGTKEIVQKSNITGETVIRDVITHAEINIASTFAGVKADKLSDYFKVTSDTSKAVFHSWATNLVPGSESVNVYMKDTKTGAISKLKAHSRFPTISDDGKYVVYEYAGNYDTDLPAVYLYNTATGKETFIAYTSGGNAYGWSTQEFTITDGIVIYKTTYPYADLPKGETTRYYVIPPEKVVAGEKL
jgi:hypothetical protein